MSLRELLQQIQDPQTSFHVIELSKYHASKITTDLEAAAYCKKSRSHFLVYGASKIRKLKGKDFHYIKLKGLVVHSPLTFQNQVVLSNEMKDVLPSDIKVSCENDLVEFEIASLCFSESAKFVIATAAMLSSDFDLAFHLLSQLEASRNALEKHKKNTPAVAHLLKIIPQRLADVSGILSEIEFNSWRMGRQHEHLKLAKKYRDKSNQLRPGDIRYFLINAIWYFVTNRDVRSAIKELNKCRAKYIQIPVWRYSSAFLHAYAGDMKNAEKEYEAAFLLDSSYEIGFEVEEFIDWVLSIEPAKFQLRYCLGLINLKIKDDIDSAASEFNKFIASDTQNLFSETKEKALTYLEEINMQLLNIRSHTHT